MAVLAMFSVVNIEEAVYQEKKLQRKMRRRRNSISTICGTPVEMIQGELETRLEMVSNALSPMEELRQCQLGGLQWGEKSPEEEQQEKLVPEQQVEHQQEDVMSDAESDRSDGILEIIRRTSVGWMRRSQWKSSRR